jgi:hypothetical protein
MKNSKIMINSEIIEEAIQISKIIHTGNLNQTISMDNYNETVKPILDEFKTKNGGSPNTLFNGLLDLISTENGLGDQVKSENFTVRGRKNIHSYFWSTLYPAKISYKEGIQLYILVSEEGIKFGLGYGAKTNSETQSVKILKENYEIAEKLYEVILKDNTLKFYNYEPEQDGLTSEKESIQISSTAELQSRWSSKSNIIGIFRANDIPTNSGEIIHNSLTKLVNVFLDVVNFDSANSLIVNNPVTNLTKSNNMDNIAQLNQILFGPPGTGKTYNSINKSISIVNPEFNLEQERTLVKTEYERLEKEGKILFTTFHQSMSYEDFIEGIKPVTSLSNGSLNYEIQAGIFKIACSRASYLCFKKHNQSKGQADKNYTFDDLYFDFIESIRPDLENGKYPKYKTKTGKEVEIFEINSQNSIKARASGSKARTVAPLTQSNLEKLFNKYDNINEIKSLDEIRNVVQVTPRSTEFFAVFGGIKAFEKTYVPDNIIEEEDVIDKTNDAEKVKKFTEGIYDESIKLYGNKAEKVVLIIDEINRGNVSQIFGELITLIEKDKRIGNPESLEVTLPYSKSKFGIPPNLYLVGTMNTADRSIEALDTALRRRFVFEEIQPNYNLKELQYAFAGIDNAGEKILKTINTRIEKLLDKDHLIGHSYFILNEGESAEEKLRTSFYKNIIPLLQEYFFGDFGKIGLVLGEGFVNLKNWNKEVDSFAEFQHESYGDFESKDVYEIIDYRKGKNPNYEVKKVKMDFEKAIKLLMKLNIE